MTDVNPYKAPGSDVTISADLSQELAGRWRRLFASLIDTIVLGLMLLPVMYLLGLFSYFTKGAEPPVTLTIMTAVIGFVLFVVVNYAPLKKNGQTIGKILLNIRITDLDGNKPDLATIILKRYLPVHAVGQVPVLGVIASIVDILFIFRSDRRCVHDLIAGTQVMRVK